MIAVDTSALMTILLREARHEACTRVITGEPDLLISAGTMAEALIVAGRRRLGEEMRRLIEGNGFNVIAVTSASAALNYGDCFAYVVAKGHSCPLLYIGDDFAKTDLQSAL